MDRNIHRFLNLLALEDELLTSKLTKLSLLGDRIFPRLLGPPVTSSGDVDSWLASLEELLGLSSGDDGGVGPWMVYTGQNLDDLSVNKLRTILESRKNK